MKMQGRNRDRCIGGEIDAGYEAAHGRAYCPLPQAILLIVQSTGNLYSIPGLWFQQGLNPHTVPATVRHLFWRDPKEWWFLHPIPTPRSTSTKGSPRRERMRKGSSKAAQIRLAKAAAAARQQQGRPGHPARPPRGSSKSAHIAAAGAKSCCTSLQTQASPVTASKLLAKRLMQLEMIWHRSRQWKSFTNGSCTS